MVQHDAIVGTWDVGGIRKPTPPASPDKLQYLSEARRQQVLVSELSSLFRVTDGKVMLNGSAICSLDKTGTTKAYLVEQMKLVRGYADLRADRLAEIDRQTHDIISFFGAALPMNMGRKAFTLHVISAIHALVIYLEMQVKHQLWLGRPCQWATEVQPVIQTPDHSSFPSGHATEAFAIATVLARLAEDKGFAEAVSDPRLSVLFRMAHRIAMNRVVAGVHWPVDSAAGAVLGVALGEAIAATMASGGGKVSVPNAAFSPKDHFPGTQDCSWSWVTSELEPRLGTQSIADPGATPLFALQWAEARKEWA